MIDSNRDVSSFSDAIRKHDARIMSVTTGAYPEDDTNGMTIFTAQIYSHLNRSEIEASSYIDDRMITDTHWDAAGWAADWLLDEFVWQETLA